MSRYLWALEMFYRKHFLGQRFQRYEVNPDLFRQFEYHIRIDV